MNKYIDRYFIKQPRLRRFVTRLIEGTRERDIYLLGSTIRIHPVMEHGYLRASRKIMTSSVLSDEMPVILNLASLLSDGDTFIDVGSNVGIFSHTLSRLKKLHPKLSFYAFEANPDTFSRLIVHSEKNGITALNVAVSDHDGVLEFIGGAVSHVFTTVENASSYNISGELVSVPCRRLDSLEIKGNSLIIKIDVEGQELNVLNGAIKLFSMNRVKAVYLDGYKDREVESFLVSRGFDLLDGRTLNHTTGGVFSLLAIRKNHGA